MTVLKTPKKKKKRREEHTKNKKILFTNKKGGGNVRSEIWFSKTERGREGIELRKASEMITKILF